MKLLRYYIPLLIFFVIIGAGYSNAQDDIVQNGSFETGDFTGWETYNQSNAGNWYIYSGNMVNGRTVLTPPVGTYAASTEQQEPSSNVLIQDLELPLGSTIQCSLIYYYTTQLEGGDDDFVSPPTLALDQGPNQQARIDIINPDTDPFNVTDGVIENLFQTQPGDSFNVGYTTLNFDLSQYAGTTVSLRAAEVDNQGIFLFSIDDVSCETELLSTAIPTLGQWSMLAMAALFAAAAILVIRRRRFQMS